MQGWAFGHFSISALWRPPIKTSLYIIFYINIISKECYFISRFFKASQATHTQLCLHRTEEVHIGKQEYKTLIIQPFINQGPSNTVPVRFYQSSWHPLNIMP